MCASRRQATAGTADKLAILRRHSLFGQLPPAVIEHLGAYMKRRRLRRGSVIFAKGEPGTGLMAVLVGAVKISVLSADGREIVLNIMCEGDIFGEMMVIERRDFIPFLRSHPDLTIEVIEILCSRLRRTTEQVRDITSRNLPTRLARALLQLIAAERPGAARKVAITQHEISQIIGRSRESTNKQLRAWEAATACRDKRLARSDR